MTDESTCPPLGTGSIDVGALQAAFSAKGKIDPKAAVEKARVPVVAPARAAEPPAATPPSGEGD